MRLNTDRGIWPVVAGAVIAVILSIFIFNLSLSLKKERSGLTVRQQELLLSRDEYLALKTTLDKIEGKKSLIKIEGVVQAVDEIFKSMGLNQKVKSVKSIGVREKQFGIEEEAELQIEKVNLNEMTNIFFRIENAPMALSIKKATVKTTFENPSLLNITMTIGIVKPK